MCYQQWTNTIIADADANYCCEVAYCKPCALVYLVHSLDAHAAGVAGPAGAITAAPMDGWQEMKACMLFPIDCATLGFASCLINVTARQMLMGQLGLDEPLAKTFLCSLLFTQCAVCQERWMLMEAGRSCFRPCDSGPLGFGGGAGPHGLGDAGPGGDKHGGGGVVGFGGPGDAHTPSHGGSRPGDAGFLAAAPAPDSPSPPAATDAGTAYQV